MCMNIHIHTHTLCIYTFAKIYLDVTETTHNIITQSIWKYNTAKHLRPLIMAFDTLAAIGHCAFGESRKRQENRWTDISILCSTGCYSANGSMLIKCSEDFLLHLLLIKINELLKEAWASRVLSWTLSMLHKQGGGLIQDSPSSVVTATRLWWPLSPVPRLSSTPLYLTIYQGKLACTDSLNSHSAPFFQSK